MDRLLQMSTTMSEKHRRARPTWESKMMMTLMMTKMKS